MQLTVMPDYGSIDCKYLISFSNSVFGMIGNTINHPIQGYNDGTVFFLNLSLSSFKVQAFFKINNPIVFYIALGV